MHFIMFTYTFRRASSSSFSKHDGSEAPNSEEIKKLLKTHLILQSLTIVRLFRIRCVFSQTIEHISKNCFTRNICYRARIPSFFGCISSNFVHLRRLRT